MQPSNPHIALLPSPGMGHLIPFTAFAKRLVHHHNLLVTILLPSEDTEAQKSFLQSLPTSITTMYLPPPDFNDLPEATRAETRIGLTINRSLQAIRSALVEMSSAKSPSSSRPPISALVVDLFGSTVLDLAKELCISWYVFFTSTAMSFSLLAHLPKLDETFTCEYRDLPEPVEFPGFVPLLGKDFLDAVQDRKNDAYKIVLQMSKNYHYADRILVNTFMDLEYSALKTFNKEGWFKPPVYPVGPLIRTSSTDETGSELPDCLTWLNKQPPNSVLYVSFGSGGTLSQEQMTELALGLEMSEQRFLWVVRSPHETAANAAFFTHKSSKDPFHFLPKGFLERTKEKGLVIPPWAPQTQILSNGSTGGFLTHCGWNSVLESIVHGVPLIAWPLYAEQKMNAILLTEDLKTALRVKPGKESGIVGREQIAKLAKDLIEGEEGRGVRDKMKELKDAAERAFGQNGSSSESLREVAQKWRASPVPTSSSVVSE